MYSGGNATANSERWVRIGREPSVTAVGICVEPFHALVTRVVVAKSMQSVVFRPYSPGGSHSDIPLRLTKTMPRITDRWLQIGSKLLAADVVHSRT